MATRVRTERIPTGGVRLDSDVTVPAGAVGVVLFVHGSGSSRHSPRNRAVADALNSRGLATALVDLLTADEEQIDVRTGALRFDIGLLADRVIGLVDWLGQDEATAPLPIGLFGASTGAAAAMVAAAARPDVVRAVVSRGGRPDLAGPALRQLAAPTLLIVGGNDEQVRQLNQQALQSLTTTAELRIVPHATHLFEEPGALAQVAQLAGQWFADHLGADRSRPASGDGYAG